MEGSELWKGCWGKVLSGKDASISSSIALLTSANDFSLLWDLVVMVLLLILVDSS